MFHIELTSSVAEYKIQIRRNDGLLLFEDEDNIQNHINDPDFNDPNWKLRTKPWDGSNVPDGHYTFYLFSVMKDGSEFHNSGLIELYRGN